MTYDALEPLTGKPLLFPPGRVAVRLDARHRSAYRELYGRYRTVLDGLPVLRDRDFDGRTVTMTRSELAALNQAFSDLGAPARRETHTPFEAQEQAREALFKRLQFLS